MNRWLVAVIAIALLTGCSWSGGANRPVGENVHTSAAPASLGDSDRVLHGVRLGMPINEARSLLTNPVLNDGPEGGPHWRQGKVQGVSVYFRTDLVWRVDNSLSPTPRGLKVGDSEQRARELYGQPAEVNKYGWLIYRGSDTFVMTIEIRDNQVKLVRVSDPQAADLKPASGREAPAGSTAFPFGPADHKLVGVEVCTPFVNLRDDKRFQERFGGAETRTETRFVTSDGHVVVYAGSESQPARVDAIEVSGGAYATARDLKVGDPLSRALALYGSTEPRGDEAVLEIKANTAGRIEKIALRCIRPVSEVKAPSTVSNTPPALNKDGIYQGTFTGWGGGLTIKRGYLVEQYPLSEQVEYLRKGSPFNKAELKTGVSIKITVQSGKVIRIEDLTP